MINFSTGQTSSDFSLLDWIKELSKISPDYIELGFTRAERIPKFIDLKTRSLLKGFKEVFIHAPVQLKDKWCNYPSAATDTFIKTLQELSEADNVTSVLFHPDIVKDFSYLNNLFGEKLSFENMDNKKDFGNRVKDMITVFEKSPQAKWVCDVNHIYTNDPTLKSAAAWHSEFKDRLRYYHLSAFGGFHSLFIDTHEDEIVEGILDPNKPIIHEGFNMPEQIEKLQREKEYILKLMSK
ncbi:MAG TPA: hypothetical protein ENI23_17505 [bacterium]|nr:hypothetical protein [bacterium]